MNRSITKFAVLGLSMIVPALLPATAAAADGDFDGIPDALELALAQRFFPTLNLHCGSYEGLAFGDRRQLYGHSVPGYPDSSSGKIPFVAHPYNPGNGSDCAEPFQCIEIRYGMAWNWDLGDDAFGGAHRGDSEMYAILVARKDTDGTGQWGADWSVAQNDVNQWRLMKEFLSAHLNAAGDSSTYRGHGQTGATTYQRVWCSEGKHGMYQTQSACNSGNKGLDDCSDNRCDIRADVVPDVQNIGEAAAPLSRYIPYPASSKTSSPSGSYDVWSGLGFGDAGDYKSRLTRPLSWCSAYTYCVPKCTLREPQCPAGDVEVGGCSGECGLRTADGVLCQAVHCY